MLDFGCAVGSQKLKPRFLLPVRPTELNEQDVFVCENTYNESEKVITRHEHGLRRILHSDAVQVDEVYILKQAPKLAREDFPFVSKTAAVAQSDNDDSNDFSRDETSNHSTTLTTPLSTKQKLANKVKPMRISGYIVYSTERRKQIQIENPDLSFGDLSRLCGQEWKDLPAASKAVYEEKASKQNELNKIKHAEMFNASNSIAYTERYESSPILLSVPGPRGIYTFSSVPCTTALAKPVILFQKC